MHEAGGTTIEDSISTLWVERWVSLRVEHWEVARLEGGWPALWSSMRPREGRQQPGHCQQGLGQLCGGAWAGTGF